MKFKFYLMVCLLVGITVTTLNVTLTEPFIFGYKWNEPVETTSMEPLTAQRVFKTTTPISPINPYSSFEMSLDKQGKIETFKASAFMQTSTECQYFLSEEVSLWRSRYYYIKNPITIDGKVVRLTLSNFSGAIYCAKKFQHFSLIITYKKEIQ